ncbi:hypothetical protein GKIL_0388 [Gloeobacter kilaueensis JS1]|uniref:Uncharacterized protein n=1 Tax=Gloeobacter kilaueensis (strain ATCC BAA-2537 / CCAP 1431/1 / ULC 316 / JS1) TaxID=1183438 RepID=U5QG30_GLOK1|nr:hypothetical protein GKIL_0388 [Gloeobacter kilaueensis JS1]
MTNFSNLPPQDSSTSYRTWCLFHAHEMRKAVERIQQILSDYSSNSQFVPPAGTDLNNLLTNCSTLHSFTDQVIQRFNG